MVGRDSNDDMIAACTFAVIADSIAIRDNDLLSLHAPETIPMITPEAFMDILHCKNYVARITTSRGA